jgi:hypothetical protein
VFGALGGVVLYLMLLSLGAKENLGFKVSANEARKLLQMDLNDL